MVEGPCSSPWLRTPSLCGVWSRVLHGLGLALLPGWKNRTHSSAAEGARSWLRRGEGGPSVFLFTVFRGRIIVVPQEESCLCLPVCLKKAPQTEWSRESLRLISRRSGRELGNEYQRGNPFSKIAVIQTARSESKGITRLLERDT